MSDREKKSSLHHLLGGWLLEMCQKPFGGQEKETNIFKNVLYKNMLKVHIPKTSAMLDQLWFQLTIHGFQTTSRKNRQNTKKKNDD